MIWYLDDHNNNISNGRIDDKIYTQLAIQDLECSSTPLHQVNHQQEIKDNYRPLAK